MVDTVRTVGELLNVLFVAGQPPHSINEQDVRDMVVSIALERTDLSTLPRSPAGLPIGRLWIDNNKALRVVASLSPVNSVDFIAFDGRGGLSAQGLKPGVQIWPGSATLAGAGGVNERLNPFTSEFTPEFGAGGGVVVRSTGSAFAFPSGVGSLLASPIVRKLNSANLSGAGLLVAGAVRRTYASRTLGGAGGLTANAQLGGGSVVWAAAANITRTDGNLWAANSHTYEEGGGLWAGTTGTSFKSSGKWYVELQFYLRTGDIRYGLANPSFDNSNYLGNDTNSWGVVDNWDGTGYELYDNTQTYGSGVAPPQEQSTVSIALDCDNWKWWTRLEGGAWSPLNGGTQNPATNQGGMSIPSGLRTGGVSFAMSADWGGDGVFLLPTAALWIYVAPSGFSAM